MPRVRQEFDADLLSPNLPTEIETDLNRYELPCSLCGRQLFVDQTTLENFERGLEHDVDNQFTCYECEQEEDVAYE